MTDDQNKPTDDLMRLSQVRSENVPVFNCQIYVTSSTVDGFVQARAATLTGISCTGPTQRAALQAIVLRLKTHFTELASAGEKITWLDPPLEQKPEEVERWIAVHL